MANEGYIPYGLDRASRSMDEILEARKRMRNAEVMSSLVRGEEYQKAIATGLEGAGKLYGAASNRYAEAATLDAKKKANIVEAKSQIATLGASLAKLDKLAKDNPNMAPEIEMQKIGLEEKRARYQSLLDSYDQEEMARILGEQSKAETKLAKEKAAVAEAGALERLKMIADNRKQSIAKANVDEVLKVDESALSKLTAPKASIPGSGLRSIDVKSEVIDAPGRFTDIEEARLSATPRGDSLQLRNRVSTPLDRTVDLTIDPRRRLNVEALNQDILSVPLIMEGYGVSYDRAREMMGLPPLKKRGE